MPTLLLSLLLFAASASLDSNDNAIKNDELVRAGFGRAVAVGDGEVFAGEPTSFRDPGIVRVFRRDASGDWREVAALSASDADVGDGFGQTLATSGSLLLVGNPSADDGTGAVYVFTKTDDGRWTESAKVSPDEAGERSAFGAALAISGDYILIGAPGHDDGAGAVFTYRWMPDGAVSGAVAIAAPDDYTAARFGSALSTTGGLLAVGAPGLGTGNGAVVMYAQNQAGDWTLRHDVRNESVDGGRLGLALAASDSFVAASLPGADRGNGAVAVLRWDAPAWPDAALLQPAGEGSRLRFGAAVATASGRLWIGEPGANDATGSVHVFEQRGGAWQRAATLLSGSVDSGDQFGGAIAASETLAAVAATGDAYGEGAAAIFEYSGGSWREVDFVYNEVPQLSAIDGGQIDCMDGGAAGYSCENVDLVSFVPLADIKTARGVRLNDVWGWTDPETGIEYALVGTMEETVFLDLSDPENPVYVGSLPKTEGSRGNTWRDIKTFNDHAFIVADGAGQHGMQVFDLRQLRDVRNPPVTFEPNVVYDKIASSHNIIINEETGFAYTVGNSSGGETCGGGLHMVDINDPLNPRFVGCFNDNRTGSGGSGATHDAQCVVYRGPDTEHRDKEICIGSNGTAISVADVTNKTAPVPISFRGYPTSSYVHQGWLTDDHRYFYQNDEGDELSGNTDRTRTMVWDLADLDDPVLVTEFFGPTNSTDHNLYVKGDYMYETNNASGLRIIDISDRERPVEFGFFDTTPYGKDVAGFNGTWSSYPYFESGMIVVTSRREGVFILKKRERDL